MHCNCTRAAIPRDPKSKRNGGMHLRRAPVTLNFNQFANKNGIWFGREFKFSYFARDRRQSPSTSPKEHCTAKCGETDDREGNCVATLQCVCICTYIYNILYTYIYNLHGEILSHDGKNIDQSIPENIVARVSLGTNCSFFREHPCILPTCVSRT